MDIGRESEGELGSDPLTPYVLLAVEGAQHEVRSPATDLRLALHRHLNLIHERGGHLLGSDLKSLQSWARSRVQSQISSRDPLVRYLCTRRRELPSMLSTEPAPARMLARRTWTDIRRDLALSSAFDKHMIARSIRHLDLPSLQHCAPLIVDIGGGPGHYSATIMHGLPTSWRCLILENYDRAGWYARSRIPSHQLRVTVDQSWPDVPPGAGLYLLASVIHNLDDNAALQLLRSCAQAATWKSQILIVERTWDSSSLSDSSRDLDMRILFGGKERTDEELCALLEISGLQMAGKYTTPDNYRVMTLKPVSS